MLITDIEADGLLREVSRFHCATTIDYFTGERKDYTEETFAEYCKALEAEAAKPDGLIVGHNFIKYDIPAIQKLKKKYFGTNLNVPRGKVLDTLVLSRLLYSNLRDTDGGYLRTGKLPGKMYGSHALEAWGYRLGEMKGEYKADFIKDLDERGIIYEKGMEWRECNQAMIDYCVQDVVVTRALTMKLLNDKYYFSGDAGPEGIRAVRLEHQAAWTLALMERNGFPFDNDKAERLYSDLSAQRSDIMVKLLKTFGSWYTPKGGLELFKHPKTGAELPKWPRVKYPKVGGIFKKQTAAQAKRGEFIQDTRDFVEGAPYTPVILETFNPGSSAHIVKVLKEAGWVPTEFTDKGAPKADDETLDGVRVDDPEKQACIDLVRRYLMLQKRIGMLAEGDNAWMRMVWDEDGCIHGNINPNGAGTGRATHSYPNMGQVPSAKSEYGPECRELFGVVTIRKSFKGWENAVQMGTDAAGLELRCLGAYGALYDNGAYVEQVLNGDVHWANALASGLAPAGLVRDKSNHDHDGYRDNAKTFIYAFLYGAGDGKIGQIIGKGAKEGKALKKAFLENTPVIAALREAIESGLIADQKWNQAAKRFDIKWKRKWLRGLDGRKIHVRSPHSALNFLLQSAGAIICKAWVVETERLALEAGLKHGWYDDDGSVGDFAFMAWVHDELQIACRTPEIAKQMAELSQQAIRNVGESFDFACILDTDAKIGDTWRDCH